MNSNEFEESSAKVALIKDTLDEVHVLLEAYRHVRIMLAADAESECKTCGGTGIDWGRGKICACLDKRNDPPYEL